MNFSVVTRRSIKAFKVFKVSPAGNAAGFKAGRKGNCRRNIIFLKIINGLNRLKDFKEGKPY